jgi:hypothetical protein
MSREEKSARLNRTSRAPQAFIETLDVISMVRMGNGQRPDLGFADVRPKNLIISSRAEIKRDGIADSTNHLFGLGDHDLYCELVIRGGKALNQKFDGCTSTRIAPELPCIRTSSA